MTGFHPPVLPDCYESSYCEANLYVSPYTIGRDWVEFHLCNLPRGEAISLNVGKSPSIPNVCPQGGGWGNTLMGALYTQDFNKNGDLTLD